MPGEFVGVYGITGTLREHTCGEQALPATDPLVFEVEMRENAGIGYWIVKAPAHDGMLTSEGNFSFETQSVYQLMEEPQAPPEPEPSLESDPEVLVDSERFERAPMPRTCSLVTTESIHGTIRREMTPEEDLPEPGMDLVGDNEIDVRVAEGSNCDFALESNGGLWTDLPCRVAYDLEGLLLEGPPAEDPEPK